MNSLTRQRARMIAPLLIGGAIFACALWFARPAPPSAVPPSVSYPNPYASPQPFMEGIYAADQKIHPPADRSIRALIVPHHLTATETIASGVKMLQQQSFKKILLISPDHFHHCQTLLCTVNGDYATQFGEVKADPTTLKTLLDSPLVTNEPELFKIEHGIYAVLPYIAHYYPGVPVTPLVIATNRPWKAQQPALLALIEQAADPDTIVIVSSDFSHYLPLTTADEMDAASLNAILGHDLNGIANLNNADQSDCPECLWALAALADARGFYDPEVVLHTNSARILGDLQNPSTTSHFSIVWYTEEDH